MKKYIIYLFIPALFAACGEGALEQVVSIEVPEHQSKLAVGAHFSPQDTLLSAFVTQSLGILDTASYQHLPEASFELFHDGSLLYNLNFDVDNLSQFVAATSEPLPSGAYELRVSHPDYETVSSFQTMPKAPEITDVEYTEEGTFDEEGYKVNEIELKLNDTDPSKNFYSVSVFLQLFFDENPTDTIEEMLYIDSNDPLLEYTERQLLLSDASFNGQDYTLRFYHYEPSENGTNIVGLRVELKAISEDRYLYLKSLEAYRNADGNPFAEPVVVHNNIQNGYGIFTLTNKKSVFIDL